MRLTALAVLAAFLLPLPALADTFTYTYTGSNFNEFDNVAGFGTPYTTSDFITGQLTLSAPLAANLTFATTITPLSFSFSDGVQTITNSSPGLVTSGISPSAFRFVTDSTGAITGWEVRVRTSAGGIGNLIESISAVPEDIAINGSESIPEGESEGDVFSSPGSWSVRDNVGTSATPEPASLLFVATGLLGGAGMVRRRVVAR